MLDWIIAIVLGIMIGGGILGYGTYWAISNERKEFNNGICTKCNLKLRHYDDTSHGDRLYTCDKCRKNVFISYSCVDRNFK